MEKGEEERLGVGEETGAELQLTDIWNTGSSTDYRLQRIYFSGLQGFLKKREEMEQISERLTNQRFDGVLLCSLFRKACLP